MSATAELPGLITLKRTLGFIVAGEQGFQLFADLDVEIREKIAKIQLIFRTSLPDSASPRTRQRVDQATEPGESPRRFIEGKSIEIVPKKSPICCDLSPPKVNFSGISESEKARYLEKCEGILRFPGVTNLTFKTRDLSETSDDKKKCLLLFVRWIIGSLFPNVPKDQIDRTMRWKGCE